MKKQFKAFWLALIGTMWLVLMASSCHKTPTPEPNPDPDLPLATQEGKYTIGCYVNGKPWWPQPYLGTGTPFLRASFNNIDNNRFFLQSVNYNKNSAISSSMSLTCKNLLIGSNLIDTIDQRLGGWSIFEDNSLKNNCQEFTLDTSKVRSIFITKFDIVNKIVAGKFEFTAFNNCGDTFRFTNGRFDTKY